jgi:NAD(P) transhydrogenase
VICDSDSILQRTDALRSVVIVGADIVGCEFACLLASLGVTVTLVERRRKLVRSADREILEVLHAGMQRLGVAIALEEQVEEIHVERSCHEPHASIRLSSGRTEKCDRLLVLAGREGRMDDLRLDQAGLTLDAGGHIAVDEYGRTAQPGVYAVGDLAGPPSRAGVALYQGRVAVQHAAGLRPPPPLDLPIALNTIPEISFVGLGEEACRRLEIPCVAGFARFQETLMGLLQPGHEGLLKLVFRREDRCLLGVQIAGKSASELVHLGLALLPAASTADQLANSIFNQPSLSEAYRLAALDALHRL